MKRIYILLIAMMVGSVIHAQSIQSFQFNLYTDSLKKGTHNYINVDAKMSNGSWRPLTDKELIFTIDNGKMEGNQLVLPTLPAYDKVTISISLKSNPAQKQSRTIWIQQKPDPKYLDPVGKPKRL